MCPPGAAGWDCGLRAYEVTFRAFHTVHDYKPGDAYSNSPAAPLYIAPFDYGLDAASLDEYNRTEGSTMNPYAPTTPLGRLANFASPALSQPFYIDRPLTGYALAAASGGYVCRTNNPNKIACVASMHGQCRSIEPGLFGDWYRYVSVANYPSFGWANLPATAERGCFCDFWYSGTVSTGVNCDTPATAATLCATGNTSAANVTTRVAYTTTTTIVDAFTGLKTTIPGCDPVGTLACEPTIGQWPWRYCRCRKYYSGFACERFDPATAASANQLVYTYNPRFTHFMVPYRTILPASEFDGPVSNPAVAIVQLTARYAASIVKFGASMGRERSVGLCWANDDVVTLGVGCNMTALPTDVCASSRSVATWLDRSVTDVVGLPVYVQIPSCADYGTIACMARGKVWPWKKCVCVDGCAGVFCETCLVPPRPPRLSPYTCYAYGTTVCHDADPTSHGTCANRIATVAQASQADVTTALDGRQPTSNDPAVDREIYQCYCDGLNATATYVGTNCQLVATIDQLCGPSDVLVFYSWNGTEILTAANGTRVVNTIRVPSCSPYRSSGCAIVSGFFPWKVCACYGGWYGLYCERTFV